MGAISANAVARFFSRQLPKPARDRIFYLTMSIVSALSVFCGFARTYYLKPFFANRDLRTIFHIHGALFSLWMVYFVLQTALIADRRLSVHRRLGYAGAGLAGAMFLSGTLAAFVAAKYGFMRPIPFAHTPEGSLFFALTDIFLFAVFVAAGFVFRRRREVHQRVMLMATIIALVPSAIGRLSDILAPTPIILAFVLAGPLYDLFTLRRIHRAYLGSLALFILNLPPIRMIAGNSAAWRQIADWVLSLR